MPLVQISENIRIKIECTSSGRKDSKIVFVGEAPGSEETITGSPFVGGAGRELNILLKEAGIERREAFLTNVFEERPADNKIAEFCVYKKDAAAAYVKLRPELVEAFPDYDWPLKYSWDKIAQGKYIHPKYFPHVMRLRREIAEIKPNLIVALGGIAAWALCGRAGIKSIRGAVTECELVPGIKVLPTYHPSYILRNWSERIILLIDLMKAKKEMAYPEIILPSRKIWINPTLEDIETFYNLYIKNSNDPISYDVETRGGQITCIGFAPNREVALVIPFVNTKKPGGNYWQELSDELNAWHWVKKILHHPSAKITQNGAYDLQYLWKVYGIAPKGEFEDTMLLHHAMYLELEKSLGFMGTLYTEERSWKLLRHRAKDEMLKKDD